MPRYLLDTSAFAKIYHPEVGSAWINACFRDPAIQMMVSRLALVEIESVIANKVKGNFLDEDGQHAFRLRVLKDMQEERILLGLSLNDGHYRHARLLVRRFGVSHNLRTLDALHLAVALDWLGRDLIDAFVIADQALLAVAQACGCPTIDPQSEQPPSEIESVFPPKENDDP